MAWPSVDSVDSRFPTVMSARDSRPASGRNAARGSSAIARPTRRPNITSPTIASVVTVGAGSAAGTCSE